jgi:hypothetical protein
VTIMSNPVSLRSPLLGSVAESAARRASTARRAIVIAALVAATMLWTGAVIACPTCSEGIRRAVRAGIFDGSFGQNLLLTMLPFGILAAISAALHLGLPRRGARR